MIHARETKLSFLLYKYMYLFNSNNTVSKWISKVKSTLFVIGRRDIWRQQHANYLKSLSSYTKKLLIEQFIQGWRGKALQSHKALAYFNFKPELRLEHYFITLPRKFYILFFKLRTSNHQLPTEVGRWDRTELFDRKCNLCSSNDIGDEFHFICKCSYFAKARSTYVKS